MYLGRHRAGQSDRNAYGAWPKRAVNTTTTLLVSDRGKIIDYTGTGGHTLNFPAAASIGSGAAFFIRNSGTGAAIVLDPSGAETIDGAATISLPINDSCFVVCDGSNWFTVGRTLSLLSAVSPITITNGAISTSMATARLIGRTTGGSGVMEEIQVGSRLSLAAGSLNTAIPAVDSKSAGYTVVAGDIGKLIRWTTAGVTVDLTAAATLGSGFSVTIRNDAGSGNLTIDPNGSETINGAATLAVVPADAVTIYTDGSNWFTASNYDVPGEPGWELFASAAPGVTTANIDIELPTTEYCMIDIIDASRSVTTASVINGRVSADGGSTFLTTGYSSLRLGGSSVIPIFEEAGPSGPTVNSQNFARLYMRHGAGEMMVKNVGGFLNATILYSSDNVSRNTNTTAKTDFRLLPAAGSLSANTIIRVWRPKPL